MSDPIQSISQSNYILHNIDAKKLYVQEPLFTANSGDAVYVGWRPDETVLWSGNATTATQTLAEDITAFDEIKVYGQSHNNYPWISNCWITGDVIYGVGAQMWWNNPAELDISRFCLSGNKIVPNKGSWYAFPTSNTTGAVTGDNNQNSYVCKVIGINRKENT